MKRTSLTTKTRRTRFAIVYKVRQDDVWIRKGMHVYHSKNRHILTKVLAMKIADSILVMVVEDEGWSWDYVNMTSIWVEIVSISPC